MSQQIDIFEYFLKFRIYNSIILGQENDVMGKAYSRPIYVNDIYKGMKWEVYTWFPYQSSDRCTEVKDITLFDIWVTCAQGHFNMNTDLCPVKISNNLSGCPMKAVVRTIIWILL